VPTFPVVEARDWDRRYEMAELLWSAGPNRFVVEELEGLAPGRALDVAAGEGRNAIWLAEHGWRVHAVDFSTVALDRGRRIAGARGVEVEWERSDLRTWAPEEGAYDLVLVAYLHVPWGKLRAILQRAARGVAPGGVFLLVGHDRTNLEGGWGGPPDPAVLYGPAQVAGELTGFEIDKAEVVRRPVETEGGTQHALDNVVRAVRRCD